MDSLDSYMQSTTQELQEEWLTLTQTKRLQVEKELETQRHLLQVAMPALPKFSMTKTTTEEQQQEEKQEEKHTKQFKKDLPISPSSSPFPSPKIPIPSSETIQKPTSSTSSQLPSVAVENPKKRVLGADLGPLSSSSCKDTIICGTQPETKKKKKKTKSKPSPLLNDPNILEGGEKVWIPPIDQTGDGRTKLNDKYGY
jgi:hypothetical protein